MAATAGPIVVGGIWDRANKTAAISSLIAATVVYWFVYLPIGLNFSNPFGAAGIGVIVGMLTMYIVTIATTESPKESGLDIKQKPSTRSGKNV